jgi:hypothetical protein
MKDVLSPRKGKDKTYWVRIGAAWDKGDKISVKLDALPLPDETGQVTFILKEKENVQKKDES